MSKDKDKEAYRSKRLNKINSRMWKDNSFFKTGESNIYKSTMERLFRYGSRLI
jgi:hypothetical protein